MVLSQTFVKLSFFQFDQPNPLVFLKLGFVVYSSYPTTREPYKPVLQLKPAPADPTAVVAL